MDSKNEKFKEIND